MDQDALHRSSLVILMQVVSDPQAEHMGPWGWGLPFP